MNRTYVLFILHRYFNTKGSGLIRRLRLLVLLVVLISLMVLPASSTIAKGKKKGNSNTKVSISYETRKNKKGEMIHYKVTTKKTYVGKFLVTYYCPCSYCCGVGGGSRTASGTIPKANRTIAADTSVLPFGTELTIGNITYRVEDRGGGIKGDRLDIFCNSHQDALNHSVKYRKVYQVEKSYEKVDMSIRKGLAKKVIRMIRRLGGSMRD